MNIVHTTVRGKRGSALVAAIVLGAAALTAAPGTANAAQRTACQMLPAATVQTILGSEVMTPGTGATPTVTNGVTFNVRRTDERLPQVLSRG